MSEVSVETMLGRQKISPHYHSTTRDDILAWLDTIPLSRPVYHLDIDFADGILVAEIVAYFFPDYVDFDLYQPARNMSQRTKNWRLLNSEVFPKLGLHAPGTVVHDITNGDHRAIELFLLHLREKIEEHLIRTGRKSRLQWETWRSYQFERHQLPPLIAQPRVKGYPSRNQTVLRNGKHFPSSYYLYDQSLKAKEEEIDVIKTKLKRYENLLRNKDRRIQQLEEQLERAKFKKIAT